MKYNEMTDKELKKEIDKLFSVTKNGFMSMFGCSISEFKLITNNLDENEIIKGLAVVHYKRKNYVMSITDNRILLVHKGIFSNKRIVIAYGSINSIDFSTGLTNGKIAINSSGVDYELKNIMNKSVEPIVGLIKNCKQELHLISMKNTSEVKSEKDVLAKIEQLFSLKEKGAISESEYTQQKNKFLNN